MCILSLIKKGKGNKKMYAGEKQKFFPREQRSKCSIFVIKITSIIRNNAGFSIDGKMNEKEKGRLC